MLGFNTNQIRRRKKLPELIFRCTISSIFGIFTQLALLSIPHFFRFSSLLFQFILSVVVLFFAIMVGKLVRRVVGVRASAPAFVFFHLIFVWLIFVIVIREVASPLINIIFNGMLVFLVFGFVRMLVSDPGFVRSDLPSFLEAPVSEDCAHLKELTLLKTGRCLQNSTQEASISTFRVRYCRICEAHILGFDHHCPAFGNCIGQENHALFMVVLLGFILSEALYALVAYRRTERNEIYKLSSSEFGQSLAVSTMIFSFVQVLWQVAFFLWHVYCLCFNIRTDEWINWRRYPEFHVNVNPSHSSCEMRFRNPYHKGIFSNLKDFLRCTDDLISR